MSYIDKEAVIEKTNYGNDCKFYSRAIIKNSELGDTVSVGNDTNIERCRLANNVVINRRNFINNSSIDTFTYTGIGCIVNFAKIGKFCSVARNVDIGGFDHRYDCVTTMPVFRLNNLLGQNVVFEEDSYCEIGNDVWIAAGTNILHKCRIGNGAIIGAGAVVTKDVEPYTIVTGIPAKPIKKRFSDDIIEALEEIKWWDWPIESIQNNINLLFKTQVTMDTIKQMKELNKLLIDKK